MAVTRFDLESAIANASNIEEDLELLAAGITNSSLDPDAIVNILIGLRALHALRFDNIHEIFEQLVQSKQLI